MWYSSVAYPQRGCGIASGGGGEGGGEAATPSTMAISWTSLKIIIYHKTAKVDI